MPLKMRIELLFPEAKPISLGHFQFRSKSNNEPVRQMLVDEGPGHHAGVCLNSPKTHFCFLSL